ncbi:SAM-dependent methyltransferase [Sphaerisporangium sp. TRM90804]|uniref:SAM-dependent methyltransferase n=1 Tax=Sphaerisporangium sp. TRM90804 TaxID=3031113 RepID=UPI0024472A09|nr:SAM-dependent methyltransferase [Sphaerisporangium sp. TRM90804]MDH2427246.1 SAM-dependent methyltransferase [Sphaerisporangium sp. TRM90804]
MNPIALGGGFDPNTPNAARMYDYFLGGKDNFPADRAAAEQVLRFVPEIPIGIRENREFLCRAVRFLSQQGIRQFLDIGAGLPTQRNVHQVAAEHAPESRTVYVDNDPQVLSHARALLQDSPQVLVVRGDLRRPDRILEDPDVRAHLDFGQPIAVLLLAILHFISDEDDPAGIVARIRQELPPGSYMAMSHVTVDQRPQAAPGVQQVYQSASAPFIARMSSEVLPLFEGLDVVEPGVVDLHRWRPELPVVDPALEHDKPYFLCGIGRVG